MKQAKFSHIIFLIMLIINPINDIQIRSCENKIINVKYVYIMIRHQNIEIVIHMFPFKLKTKTKATDIKLVDLVLNHEIVSSTC